MEDVSGCWKTDARDGSVGLVGMGVRIWGQENEIRDGYGIRRGEWSPRNLRGGAVAVPATPPTVTL